MKKKKTASANLENKRFIFFQIGIIIGLAFALTAFEMKSYDENSIILPKDGTNFIEDELPPITIIKKERIPPKPAIPDFSKAVDDLGDDPVDFEINAEIDFYDELPEWNPPDLPEELIKESDVPVDFVQNMPEFPGGSTALLKFLNSNINYPDMAIETEIEGVVYIGFVVEKDGSITNIVVVRGIGGGCNEEAVRVAKMMPKWKAGRQMTKTVRVRYTLPIRFVLQK